MRQAAKQAKARAIRRFATVLLAIGLAAALHPLTAGAAQAPSQQQARPLVEKASGTKSGSRRKAASGKAVAGAEASRGDQIARGVDVVEVQVEHTLFHPMEDIVLNVERMRGRLVGQPGRIISLDDRHSFSVYLDQAVTRLSAQNLSRLINSYLLQQADSAIKHVEVRFEGQQVLLSGDVHKVIPLPFSGRGALSATPAGELRIHMTEFRVAGVLNENFLSFFGIHLDDVASPHHASSFRIEGNDFITPLHTLFPPPIIYGHLSSVHIEGQDMVQVIGVDAVHHAVREIPRALVSPPNYIYFSGGRLQFGKVTMDNVDLKMVDKSPQTPFDFSLDHYQQQIEAGYVKVMPTLGLVVYAEDYADLAGKTR